LNKPIVGMAPAPSGQGYWLVASDGGMFAFSDAQFFGSLGNQPPASPVTAMESTGDSGYWIITAVGQVFHFGDAKDFGSA
jgi:hypothetical protein